MSDRDRPRRWSDPRFDRPFFLGISVVFLGLVFWTFARTFFLKAFFATPALTPLLHIHGIVMSGWVVLLAVQSGLIVAHRVRWHRRLGVFGAGWAVLLVIMGSVTTVHAAAREVRGHTTQAAEFVVIMGLDVLQMIFFAAYVGAAIRLRRRPDYHKRFMLLTIACMLPDALARLPVPFMTNPVILLGINGFVILCVGIDTMRHRRLHPAFGWGAGVFLGVFNVALPVFAMSGWVTLASRWLS